jgi:GntR family transcriptional regulator, arabinose operon transcriptional repressor
MKKYEKIYYELLHRVQNGNLNSLQNFPTETSLSQEYGVSRPTIAKALALLKAEVNLEQSKQNIENEKTAQTDFNFGLLIPGLGEGEIFEPICAYIASQAHTFGYTLSWRGIGSPYKNPIEKVLLMENVCDSYIKQKVSGVFFAPIELIPDAKTINLRIANNLKKAGIAVILIDGDILPFPEKTEFDLIGLDNFKAGYNMCSHLIQHGTSRVDFFVLPFSANTESLRIQGYKCALLDNKIIPDKDWIHIGLPSDLDFVADMIKQGGKYIVCGNDSTAASLIDCVKKLNMDVPDDVKIVGFDDIKYAKILTPPLTTYRQPCEEIGALAIQTMLSRIRNNDLAKMRFVVEGNMIIRKSCGCK